MQVERGVNPRARFTQAALRKTLPAAFEFQSFFTEQTARASLELQKARKATRTELTGAAKVLLCTSASIGPALRDDYLKPLVLRSTTIVCDEAGNIGDRHVLPAIMSCPTVSRFVLVGDTKQLPMFSYIRDEEPSSMMERLEQHFSSHLLTIQYRCVKLVER